jgi:hypothetical protein
MYSGTKVIESYELQFPEMPEIQTQITPKQQNNTSDGIVILSERPFFRF